PSPRVVTQPGHRRPATPCRELRDLRSVIEERSVYENDEPARPLVGHRREGAVDLTGASRPQELKPHAQGPGRILPLARLWRVAWVGRIREQRYPRNPGDDLLEHLQLLADQIGRHHGIPGEV